MATYTKSICLDVDGSNRQKYVYAKQNDNASRFINVIITAQGQPITYQQSDSAYIRAEKPDGTLVHNPAVINNDGTITAELTAQMLAVAGELKADIYVQDETNSLLSTVTFYVFVDASPCGQIDSENEFITIQEEVDQWLDSHPEAITGINDALDAVYSLFSQSNNTFSFIVGSGPKSNGLWENNTAYCRTTLTATSAAIKRMTYPDGYWCRINYFSSSSNAATSTYLGYQVCSAPSLGMLKPPSNTKSMVLFFRGTDRHTITNADASTISAGLKLYTENWNLREETFNNSLSALMYGKVWEPNLVVGEGLTNGAPSINSKRCRTKSLWLAEGNNTAICINRNEYQMAVYEYGSTSTYGSSNYVGSIRGLMSGLCILPPKAKKIACVFCRVDNADMTADDVAAIQSSLMVYKLTDKDMSQSNIPADAQAVGEALKVSGIMTNKNNQTYVSQILQLAESYLNQGFEYGQSTILDANSWDSDLIIDCSTYVGLLLRGRGFTDTRYGSSSISTATTKTANPNYIWSINPYDYELQKELSDSNLYPVRTASQLAEWMLKRGWRVPLDTHLSNVMPGDVVFYARKNISTDEWVCEDRFMHISHVGIVTDKVPADGTQAWDTTKLPWVHTVMDSTAREGSIGSRILEDGAQDEPSIYTNNYHTVVMVCRPDLGAIAPYGGGGGGSDNAVLYTPQTLTTAQKQQACQNIGAGTYSKPATGMPKTDFASEVQASLNKADSALQQHQDISGKEDKTQTLTVTTGGDVSQALDAEKIYVFSGALTSLTLTFNAPASGDLAQYHFIFAEGSTAFDPVLPNGVVMPDNHTWEADTRYEVDILNNYAVVVGWAVS